MVPLTKKQLIEKLTILGIEHDPKATNAVLEALLPKETSTNSTDPASSTHSTSTDTDDDVDSVTVTYQNPQTGQSERVFSREIHGAKFKEVANMFLEKFGGELV